MANDQVNDFIEKSRATGKTDEEIAKDLLSVGWTDEEIRSSFAFVNNGFASTFDSSTGGSVSQPGGEKFYNPFELMSRALVVLKNRFWVFVRIFLSPIIFMFAVLVAGAAILFLFHDDGIIEFGLYILGFFIFLFTIICSQIAFMSAIVDDSLSAIGAYKRTFKIFWSYAATTLLASLLIFGATILFIIPGIIIAVWLSFYQYILISGEEKGMRALGRSREYVRGFWWGVLGRTAFIIVFLIVVQLAMRLILANLNQLNPIISLVGILFLGIFNVIAFPLASIYQFLVFKNIKTIKFQSNSPVRETKNGIFIFFIVVAVVLIIGVFVGMPLLLVNSMSGAGNVAKDARIRADMDMLRSEAEIYKIANGSYGNSLSNFTTSGEGKILIDEIISKSGNVLTSFKGDKYCIQAELSDDSWFQKTKKYICMDSAGGEGEKCTSDCRCSSVLIPNP
ncbi:MAG: hypothetical protein WC520_00140 [Candidatus Paceibacterota bacterium]